MFSDKEKRGARVFRLVVSLAFSLYFIILSFNLLPIPEYKWALFAGGIVLMLFYAIADDNLSSFPSSLKKAPNITLLPLLPFTAIYFLVGLYFALYPFNILPNFILNFHSWLLLIGGAMMLFGQFLLYPILKPFLPD